MENDTILLALRNVLALEATAKEAGRLVEAKAATTNLIRAHGISDFTVRRIRKDIATKYKTDAQC